MGDRIKVADAPYGSKSFADPGAGVGTHDARRYNGPELGGDAFPSVPLTPGISDRDRRFPPFAHARPGAVAQPAPGSSLTGPELAGTERPADVDYGSVAVGWGEPPEGDPRSDASAWEGIPITGVYCQ